MSKMSSTFGASCYSSVRSLWKKRGKILQGLARITRRITNCVTNSYLRSLGVDLNTLLGASGWCYTFNLWNSCYIFWCSDDLKGASFVLVVPDKWGAFLTFSKMAQWGSLDSLLDDGDSPLLTPWDEVADHLSRTSSLQTLQRESVALARPTCSEDKAVEGEPIVERMGCLEDGLVGRVSVPEGCCCQLTCLPFGC